MLCTMNRLAFNQFPFDGKCRTTWQITIPTPTIIDVVYIRPRTWDQYVESSNLSEKGELRNELWREKRDPKSEANRKIEIYGCFAAIKLERGWKNAF